MGESIFTIDGLHFTCKKWPHNRLTDCRINGRKVSVAVYRLHRDGWQQAEQLGDRTEVSYNMPYPDHNT